MFTNATTSVSASAANLIAGTQLQLKSLTSLATSVARVTNNMGSAGIFFPNAGIITQITITSKVAPTGLAGVGVRIRQGTTYATSNVISGSFTLPQNSLSAKTNVSITLASGDYIYVDITGVSSFKSVTGLAIQLGYYSYGA